MSGDIKSAVIGHLETTSYHNFISVSLPKAFVALSVTFLFQLVRYVCVGFCAVLPQPSQNVQIHEVGVLVESSVNVTKTHVSTVWSSEWKSATGGPSQRTIYHNLVSVENQYVFVAVIITL